jgi:hypothetical protein
MALAFPQPDYMPCPDCGGSVCVHGEPPTHVCDEDRRLDFDLVEFREEIERLEPELAEWLETPDGRFAAWLAEHGRG